MNLETISKLEEMEKGATHGPWQHVHGEIGHLDRDIVKPEDAFDWVLSMQISNSPNYRDDAEFIVSLRNNAPELLAMARWALENGYKTE